MDSYSQLRFLSSCEELSAKSVYEKKLANRWSKLSRLLAYFKRNILFLSKSRKMQCSKAHWKDKIKTAFLSGARNLSSTTSKPKHIKNGLHQRIRGIWWTQSHCELYKSLEIHLLHKSSIGLLTGIRQDPAGPWFKPPNRLLSHDNLPSVRCCRIVQVQVDLEYCSYRGNTGSWFTIAKRERCRCRIFRIFTHCRV